MAAVVAAGENSAAVAVAGTASAVVVAGGAAVEAVGPGLEPPIGGRRRLPHSGPEVVSSARLHHGWVREGEEMERLRGI